MFWDISVVETSNKISLHIYVGTTLEIKKEFIEILIKRFWHFTQKFAQLLFRLRRVSERFTSVLYQFDFISHHVQVESIRLCEVPLEVQRERLDLTRCCQMSWQRGWSSSKFHSAWTWHHWTSREGVITLCQVTAAEPVKADSLIGLLILLSTHWSSFFYLFIHNLLRLSIQNNDDDSAANIWRLFTVRTETSASPDGHFVFCLCLQVLDDQLIYKCHFEKGKAAV